VFGPLVAAGPDASPRLFEGFDPVLADDLRRRVGAPPVDDRDLPRDAPGLGLETRQCPGQIPPSFRAGTTTLTVVSVSDIVGVFYENR